jgi:penicillin-binding protein 2
LERVETANGDVVFENEKQVIGKLPVSKKNLEIVRKGLWEVVNSNRGTAKIAKLKTEHMSGKTGTAQVVGRKKIENLKESQTAGNLRTMPGSLPMLLRKIQKLPLAIIVEHGEHGSSAAAPIAKQLIETYLELEKID